jgi:hypothetical protein
METLTTGGESEGSAAVFVEFAKIAEIVSALL